MLKTSNVFVDTEQWRSIRFDWKHELAVAVQKSCADRLVKLKTTFVVQSEIEAQIESGVDDYVASLMAATNRCTVALRNCGNVLSGFDSEASALMMKHELVACMRGYFRECSAEEIKLRPNVAYQVLGDYFGAKPPFEQNAKKKHEFPDAFSLIALHDWCRDTGENIYVVSQDKGVRAYCEKSGWLIHIPTLPDLIKLVYEEDPSQISIARELALHSREVESAISATLIRLPAYASNAENVSIENVSVSVSAFRLVLSPSPTRYVIYADAEAHFLSVLSGEDPHSHVGTGHLRDMEIAVHTRLKARFKLDVNCSEGQLSVEGAEPLDGDQINIEADLWEDPSGVLVRAHIEDGSLPF